MEKKPGYQTSEFWLSLVSAGLLVANKGLGLDIDEGTVMAFAGMVITYVISRAVVKAK